MKLIGLCGKKLSGKDTAYVQAADILRRDHKLRVGRVAFADPLKQEVSEITGFRVEFIEEHKKEFRSLLQVWGTEFRRQWNGSDYWINKMSKIVEVAEDHFDVLFITDVRFKNEADFIRRGRDTHAGHNMGQLVRVERRSDSRHYPAEVDTHITENDLDDYSQFDYVLNNDKTKEELNTSLTKMLQTLKIIPDAA